MSGRRRTKPLTIPAEALRLSVPRWECHVHTQCGDGDATVEAMVERAIELELERIIFTEHTEPWHTTGGNWFAAYMTDIRSARKRFGRRIEIIAGLEAPAVDLANGLQLTPTMQREVDFVIGSAHRYPGIGQQRVRDLTPEACIEYEYQTLMALAANPTIDAIGHLGGTCSKYCCELPKAYIEKIIHKATSHGIAIEINTRSCQPFEEILSLCMQRHANVTLASDAHCVDDVGIAFQSISKLIIRKK